MNIHSILAKVSLLKYHPEWVDGGPGQPGPVFRLALTEYAVAGIARQISRRLTDRELASKLHQSAKDLVGAASKMLPATWEDGDGDDICPPYQWHFPFPPRPTGGDDPEPHPWLVSSASVELWLENASPAMQDAAMAVALRDLASVTTVETISSSFKQIGESVTKQAGSRLFDEYCGTPVKPRIPAPRGKSAANAA